MSIASEIQRLRDVRERIYNAIVKKGGLTQEEAESGTFDHIPEMIEQLPVIQSAGLMFECGEDEQPVDFTFYGESVPAEFTRDPKEYMMWLTILEGTRIIGDEAFSHCSELRQVELPDSVTEIRYRAFEGCRSMTLNALPKALETIGDWAFGNCVEMEIDTIPAGVTHIGDNAFYGCSCLEDITFLGTPEEIADTAFFGCAGIQVIRVPWSKGAVAGAPWGAEKAVVVYDWDVGEVEG